MCHCEGVNHGLSVIIQSFGTHDGELKESVISLHVW